jgi:hypothetical protein
LWTHLNTKYTYISSVFWSGLWGTLLLSL